MIKHLGAFLKNPDSRTIGIIFALCGLGFGTWASFIPFVKEKFNLDEAQLGLMLLCLPLGNFIANPLTVFFIRRWGPVRMALGAGALSMIFFAMPVALPNIVFASFGLCLAGGAFGTTNVSMNTCASLLEDKNKLRIMATCHGMWSVGAMAGALLSGVIMIPIKLVIGNWSSPQTAYVVGLSLIIVLVTILIRNNLDQIKEAQMQSGDQAKIDWKVFRPNRALWMLITICLCTYLTEGTMADWSGVYLREITLSSETIAGWGFGLYSFLMATGRFLGDNLIARFGSMRVLRAGGVLVLIGLIIVIMSNNPWVALPGFMLVGAGISLASPILYGAAAKLTGLTPGVGLATLNTFAMASFLGGPVLIGFVAKFFDLRIAFMLVGITVVVWIIQTTRVIRTERT